MLSCLHETLVQYWHKSSKSNQPMSDWMLGPLHEREPMPDTAQVTKQASESR